MDHLVTETRNNASIHLDLLSAEGLVHLMCSEDARIPKAIAACAPTVAKVIEKVTARMRNGGRLIYMGAGTSGRLGVLDATECPPTFSVPPGLVIGLIAGGERALTTAVEGAEDHPEFGVEDLKRVQITPQDSVVGIATSGRTPYVAGGLDYARSLGAYTVAFSCNPHAEINACAEEAIGIVVGPEILTGSTRLKSGTATKLVLNMISTGVMVALGKTFGNLMVDLRATNVKLKARANRIIRQITGMDENSAAKLLESSGNEVKTAIVCHLLQTDAANARNVLSENQGGIRKAISASPEKLGIDASLVVGIDGGGTKTSALLAKIRKDGFEVLGRGIAGASNPRVVGFENASLEIHTAIHAAFQQAKIPLCKVHRLVAGLSGAGREEERKRMGELLQDMAQKVEVTSDANLILEEGLLHGWGIAVIAGTGSMILGKNHDGTLLRSGGWGTQLGDEGSAYAIGMSALKALCKMQDGLLESGPLRELLLGKLGLTKVEDLIAPMAEGTWGKETIAELALEVLALAEKNDLLANQLLQEQANALAQGMAGLYRRLQIAPAATPLAFAGSLFCKSNLYRTLFIDQLHTLGVPLEMQSTVHEPALGALRLGCKQ